MIDASRASSLSLTILLVASSLTRAQTHFTLDSPNQQLRIKLALQEGVPTWQLAFDTQELIEPSGMGVEIGGASIGPLESVTSETLRERGTVETVWGKFSRHKNHFNEIQWTLRESTGARRLLRIVLRAYDQGVAFRYEFPKEGNWSEQIALTSDGTEFRFADNATAWAYHREHDPYGPQQLSRFHSDGKGIDLPLTLKNNANTYMAVLEAAAFHHAPYRLVSIPDGDTAFRATFVASTLPAGESTSWRVILVGRQPGDLLLAPIPYCLNPSCALEDTDWIRPGLAFWDWRAWGAKTKSGFTYELDMASWRRFVDFASENNVRYLVLDANWYGPEFDAASDPRTSRDHLVIQLDMEKPKIVRKPAPANWKDPINVPALIRYAKNRNVGVILYINDVARSNYPFEDTLATYQRWGAAGIKYGFMKGKGQQKVLDTREIVRLCAKYHLLCNFHDGPIPPSGDRRTYPNYLTREFCHSQSDALRVFSPTGFCEQVFVNMVAGPLDMCNGLYTLNNPAEGRPRIFTNVEATVVAETARVMITFSGLSILPDCPEAYEEKSDLFQFLSRLPMTWDETRILHSAIGEYITTARRSGDDWFIASATNEQARTLPIPLTFLEDAATYSATAYEDASDAHFQTNREAYSVRQFPASRDTIVEAHLAPGGGHCLHLQRQ